MDETRSIVLENSTGKSDTALAFQSRGESCYAVFDRSDITHEGAYKL